MKSIIVRNLAIELNHTHLRKKLRKWQIKSNSKQFKPGFGVWIIDAKLYYYSDGLLYNNRDRFGNRFAYVDVTENCQYKYRFLDKFGKFVKQQDWNQGTFEMEAWKAEGLTKALNFEAGNYDVWLYEIKTAPKN